MKKIPACISYTALALLILLTCANDAPLQPLNGYSCGEHFVIGTFVDPPMTLDRAVNRTRMSTLRDNGFNTLSGWAFGEIDGTLEGIRLAFDAVKDVERGNECSQYSLRVLVREWASIPHNVTDTCDDDGQVYRHYVSPTDSAAQSALSRYGNSRGADGITDEDRLYMAGYFPVDEPDPLIRCGDAYDDVAVAGAYAAKLKAADPDKWVLINLWGNVGREGIANGDEYRAYINRVFDLSGSDVIAFDLYPFNYGHGWSNNMVPTYFYVHRIYAEECRRLDKRYFSFVYSSPDDYSFGDYIGTTPSSLRFMCHTPIAYGATGIFYFTYWGVMSERGLYDSLGNATELQPYARDINTRILNISDELMSLSWISTVHGTDHDPYSREGGLATTGEIVDSVNDSLFFVGEFEGPAAKEFYLIVVNKDWSAEAETNRTCTISLKVQNTVETIDAASRPFLDSVYTDVHGNRTTISVRMLAGEMCVLRVF